MYFYAEQLRKEERSNHTQLKIFKRLIEGGGRTCPHVRRPADPFCRLFYLIDS